MNARPHLRNYIAGFSVACLLMVVSMLGGAQLAYAQNATCNDGTAIPATAIGDTDRETSYCSSFGGFTQSNAGTCNDGTPLSDQSRTGGHEDEFCSSHGGYTVGTAPTDTTPTTEAQPKHQCGSNLQKVATSINFGCTGEICITQPSNAYCTTSHNAIIDVMFAIIRFLSLGVGLVVIGSIIVAGIQFTTSRGDPNATSKAIGRIRSSVLALFIYIFAYALLNYIIPNGFFR